LKYNWNRTIRATQIRDNMSLDVELALQLKNYYQ